MKKTKNEIKRKLMYKEALERIKTGEFNKRLKEEMESARDFVEFLKKKRKFSYRKLQNRVK